MELKEYWNLLWKWKWLIVIGILLASGTAFLISRSQTPVYRVTTRLLVIPGSSQSIDSYATLVASERLAQTYAELLKSEPMVKETYERLGLLELAASGTSRRAVGFSLPTPVAWLNPWLDWAASRVGYPLPERSATVITLPSLAISSEPVRDTQLVNLHVEGTSPDLITRAANTLVEVFTEWQVGVQQSRYAKSKANLAAGMERAQADIEQIETKIDTVEAQGERADSDELARLQEQLTQYSNSLSALLNNYSNIELAEASSGATVTVVSPAVRPRVPIRPQVMRTTLMAAMVGGLLAVGVAFLIEYLDDTAKTPDDLLAADLNLLAAVQQVKGNGRNGREELYVVGQPRSMVSESYRTLRTNLQFSSLDKPLRSLMVTSALAGEGKTTTAANLAVVLAQDGKRVVLVDADLRRPNLHRLFDLPNRVGLTTALVDESAALDGHLRSVGIENLRLLTAGPVPPNPQEMLGSERMADLLEHLQEQADVVLLDTPPALAVADANVLASRVDAVVLVVNTNQTRRAALQQAAEGLRKVGAKIVGGVLNMVPSRKGDGYYYQYYYYSDYRQEEERPGNRGRSRPSGRRGRRSRSSEGQTEPAHGGS